MKLATPSTPQSKLAIHGGKPLIARPAPSPKRWGDPEREQLSKMIEQRSLFYWKGPQTTLLVERFREQYPLQHVFPCSSGTAAIHIAVAAAGVGPGDEVITTPITDMGTVIGILYQQAVPVFADLEPHTYNLDPADVRKKITSKTKAILLVHLAGNPCNLEAFRTLAEQHNLVLIEDCAQAWGAKYRGRAVGTIGHIGCYSLNDFKHIGCGDGGIVASNDERFGPLLQKFGDKAYDRSGGARSPDVLAANYRISEPQSAVAAAQMLRLEDIVVARTKIGTLLSDRLEKIPGIHIHQVDPQDRCTFWFYWLRIDPSSFRCSRDEFVDALSAEGVPAWPGYIPTPVYQYPIFQNHNFFAGRWPVRELGLTDMDYTKVRCAEAEAILADGVRMPINEAMDEAWIEDVAAAIQKVAAHFAG